MRLVVFRNRLRDSADPEYAVQATKMVALAEQQPGFRSVKTFTADDGERVTLAEFETDADVRAWAQHPEHRVAQRLGRERFYSEYTLQVCGILRQRKFSAPD